MSRRPARFTQADIARAIRAMKQTGAAEVAVRFLPDGGIDICPQDRPGQPTHTRLENRKPIPL